MRAASAPASSSPRCRRGPARCGRRALRGRRRGARRAALADDGVRDAASLEALDAMLLELSGRRREKEEELRGVEAQIIAGQRRRDQLAAEGADVVGSSENDYSFKTRSTGVYLDTDGDRLSTPANIFVLAFRNFYEEWKALRRFVSDSRRASRGDDGAFNAVEEYGSVCADDEEECVVDDDTMRQREMLKRLTLDSEAVWARERRRAEPEGPWWVKVPYFALCYLLDALFDENEPISRFFFLEVRRPPRPSRRPAGAPAAA